MRAGVSSFRGPGQTNPSVTTYMRKIWGWRGRDVSLEKPTERRFGDAPLLVQIRGSTTGNYALGGLKFQK